MSLVIALVVYYLAAFGLAWVVGSADISYDARSWLDRHVGSFLVDLLECPGCAGWWIGTFAGFLPQLTVVPLWPLNVALFAFSTAGLNMVLARLAGLKQ